MRPNLVIRFFLKMQIHTRQRSASEETETCRRRKLARTDIRWNEWCIVSAMLGEFAGHVGKTTQPIEADVFRLFYTFQLQLTLKSLQCSVNL